MDILIDATQTLEKAGVDFIVLCTNTLHKLVHDITKEINIPFLNIAEVKADELNLSNINGVGLFGTKPTIMSDFYKAKLIQRGIEPIIPSSDDIAIINSTSNAEDETDLV